MGLSTILSTASRSLEAFTAGIQVAGHNVANANTPGYVREELKLETAQPFKEGDLILGAGVDVAGVQQRIDRYLETRIHTANADAASASERQKIYEQLEREIGELGDDDLSSRMNAFVASLEEVANQPELSTLSLNAVEQGRQLADGITSLRTRIDELRKSSINQVSALVSEANGLIQSINELNTQISQLELGGNSDSEVGALRSQRYAALNRLSEIIPIQTIEQPNGATDVYHGPEFLVQAGKFQQLEEEFSLDRGVLVQQIRTSELGGLLSFTGGEIGGVVEGRDKILGSFIDQLDTYTSNLISEFNRIHSSGEGSIGFQQIIGENQVDATNVALNAAGLAFPPGHGSFDLKVVAKASGIAETTNIAIDLDGIGPDSTLEDLRAQLDAVDNISASITADRRLRISADSGFEVRFGNDSSGILSSLGMNTFFAGSDSTDVGVNPLLLSDPRFFAAGQGGGPADGRNAVAMARFLDEPVAALGGETLNGFYENLVASTAQASALESTMSSGLTDYQASLFNQRAQISGVSLDEEAVLILEYQAAYQAAARIISTVDELLTLITSL